MIQAMAAAAGMLAPQIEAAEGDPLFPWAVAGRERYATLAVDLKESTGIDIEFWQEGIARWVEVGRDRASTPRHSI